MKRGSVSHDLGAFPSLGGPDFHGGRIGGQKGWSSERVPLPTSSGQRHAFHGSTSLMGLSNGGRTLPSKWEDAERWICSPVLGYGCESNKNGSHSHGHGQQRRPKSKSGPIVPPGAVYYSNFSPANPAFDGCGSVRNFAIGSPFSTGVLAADSVSLLYGGSGGMGRSTSALGLLELQNEKLDNTKCEEPAISRAVSQRDMGTQINPNGCLHHSPPPPKRRSSFAPSSPTLLSIVEQQREHFAKLEVREVQVDNGATGTKGSRRGGSITKRRPDVYDFDKIAIKNQPPSFNIAEAAMNSSRKQREEAKITAWENLQKAKAEAALRKLEMKLEKKRSSTMDKIMKKVRTAQVKAHKMRSSIAVKDGHQAPKTPGKLVSFGKLVRGGSLSSCFTRNAT
ncbi:hypothetical protein CerSpe_251430 [Prunus speciosa]